MENKTPICYFHIFLINILRRFKMPYKTHDQYYLNEEMKKEIKKSSNISDLTNSGNARDSP